MFSNIFDSNNAPACGPLVAAQMLRLRKEQTGDLFFEIAREAGLPVREQRESDLTAGTAGTVGGAGDEWPSAQGERQMAQQRSDEKDLSR